MHWVTANLRPLLLYKCPHLYSKSGLGFVLTPSIVKSRGGARLSVLAQNTVGGWLWGQFWVSKLHLIDSTIESAIVRHALRNILGYGLEKIGPPRPEVQCKTWHFQKVKLWGQVSPTPFAANWNPPGHVVYPTSFTPGNWNFYDISTYKNVAFLGPSWALRGPDLGRASR